MVKLNKIYMCIGDGGSIGLVDGLWVLKVDVWMCVIGDVDEVNSVIGVVVVVLGEYLLMFVLV